MARRHANALLALTSSALALPGISSKSHAASPAAESQVDYRYSSYSEDDLSRSKTSNPDTRRYEIDTHQFRLVRPWGDEYDVTVDLLYETMSGASPWFITPGANNQPIQVMSGATIDETRIDMLASLRRYYGNETYGVSLGVSDEDDYQSINLGVEAQWDIDEQQRSYSLGIGYSDDDLEPTDGASAAFPDRISDASKDSLTAYAGVTQIINAQTTVQSSISFTRHDGFLSDPYKLAFVNGTTTNDSRPDGREQFAWFTRFRHFFTNLRAALHLDYRYFEDDWDITSHTAEAAWYQNLGDGWQVVPSIRFYSQSQAFFYAPFYGQARTDGFASSDYRLSPYGALSMRFKVSKAWAGWKLSMSWEEYDSDAGHAIGDVDVENPGLVDFSVISFGISKRF